MKILRANATIGISKERVEFYQVMEKHYRERLIALPRCRWIKDTYMFFVEANRRKRVGFFVAGKKP